MADEILIETTTTEVLEVATVGPQGPKGDKGDPGDIAGEIAWDNITSKPSTFPPSSHTHTASEITSLQAALDGKAATSHTHTSAAITDFAAAVVAAAPPTTDASLLTSGTLADARLSSAVTASLAKADSASQPGHTHVAANVSDFNTAAAAAAPVQSVAGRTGAVTLAVADVANAVATSDARLSDARTPTAHKSTHATGGTDALTPGDIGAQSLFTTSTYNITSTGSFTLTAARAQIAIIVNFAGAATVTLPTSGNVSGDVAVVRANPSIGTLTVAGSAQGSETIPTTGSKRYVYDGSNWQRDLVYTHAHTAADISDSTTAGRALLTAADAAAQRTSLGLGSAAVEAASAFAAASHTHGNLTSDGKVGSTAGLPLVTTTAGAVTTLALGSAGQVLKVNSGGTAVEFGAAAAGGTKTYAVFAATDNQPPSTAFATLDTRGTGIAVLDFDDATDESAVFVGIIPEGASLGSGLKIRLHWMATSATSGNCVWDVSLERMTTDLDSDSFDSIASGTAAANGTSGILTVTEITLTTIDSVTAGDGFRLKVTRDANNGSDTMSGDAELVVVEVRSAA